MSNTHKLDMHTKDKSQENFEKLKALFPNAVTETVKDGKIVHAIDKDVLMQEINAEVVEGKDERYQFTWPEKKKAVLLANSPTTKTLRPYKEESVNFDSTKNLYIEGDNLEVLKLLQETYLGKVKMIYIDPPYNTGKDSFVYDDKRTTSAEEYKDMAATDEDGNLIYDFRGNAESNGYFHTDWLNMMYPRLRLARDLLTDDGVIFISIDDNEVSNLKKICDEIFGERNFVSNITIIVKTEGRRYGFFAKTHENLLVYCKTNENLNLNEIEVEGADFLYSDELGGYNLTDLRNQNTRAFNNLNRPNLHYPFYVKNNAFENNEFSSVKIKKESNDDIEIFPITINNIESVWRWGKEKAEKELHNLIARKGSDNIIRIFQKYRKLTQTPKTVWFDKDFISNKGTKEIQSLLGTQIFNYPKPIAFSKQLLNIATNCNETIILDFFSGSATTAHAVMQLNAEDKGKRQFIMVQLPETTDEDSEAYKAGYKNICEIGKERIRRAGKKILQENSLTENDLDIGFRVLKLDTTNMKDVHYTPAQYQRSLLDNLENNIKEDRSPEDLLFQVLLDLGVELSSSIASETIGGKTVFNVENNYCTACFDTDLTNAVITEIAKKQPVYAVFRDISFNSDSVGANVEQIFKTYSPNTKITVL